MIIDSTTHEEFRKEREAYEKSICKLCDFNYVITDGRGMIRYCPVADIYEDRMMMKRKCEHYRVRGKYIPTE